MCSEPALLIWLVKASIYYRQHCRTKTPLRSETDTFLACTANCYPSSHFRAICAMSLSSVPLSHLHSPSDNDSPGKGQWGQHLVCRTLLLGNDARYMGKQSGSPIHRETGRFGIPVVKWAALKGNAPRTGSCNSVFRAMCWMTAMSNGTRKK